MIKLEHRPNLLLKLVGHTPKSPPLPMNAMTSVKPNARYVLLSLLMAAFSMESLCSETIRTPTMGFVKMNTTAESDSLFGLPMNRTPVFVGAITAVTENEITVDGSFTGDQLVSGSDTFYALVTSGALKGYSFTVTGNTLTTISVDPNADDDVASQGLQADDLISVIPYWTLRTLFPAGKGIADSPDARDPQSTVKVYDATKVGINLAPSKTYFYYTGSAGTNGWYDNDDLGAGIQDSAVLIPESFLMVRNVTEESEDVFVNGYVPVTETGTAIGRFVNGSPQDNLTVNPYPISLTLGTSGLFSSGAVEATLNARDPGDTVKLYTTKGGYNPAPDKTYFYYGGNAGAHGWYDNDDLGAGVQDDIEIPAGAAVVIRKKSGSAGTTMWIPPVPYSN